MAKKNTKKRIAVFANGWNGVNLDGALSGIMECLPENYADLFVFLSYASYGHPQWQRDAEHVMFDMPDLSTFDGAIIYGPGLNFPEAIDKVVNKCLEADIPVVTVGIENEKFSSVKVDNYNGMKKLINHIIEAHGVKRIAVIAGSKDNQDSNERIKAVRDSLSDHGLSLCDDDVYYSNWEINIGARCAAEIFEGANGGRPDALVAANDFLAMFSILEIEKRGGVVPRDIIVTGFDAINDSSVFYPSVASVNQNQNGIGKLVAELLIDRLKGGDVSTRQSECDVYPGESCKCKECRNEREGRNVLGRSGPEKKIFITFKAERLSRLEAAVLSSDRYSNLASSIRNNFYDNVGFEGEVFYLNIDPMIAQIARKEPSELPAYKMANKLDVLLGREQNYKCFSETVDTREIIPDYYKYKEYRPNSVYIICPFYYKTFVCGYTVLGYKKGFFDDDFYFDMRERMRRALENYKKNLQLAELYDQLSDLMQEDPLTHVRNRRAYEKYKETLEDELSAKNINELAVVLFDINNLKHINDNLGHEAGDEYIRNCSQHICHTFKHSPVFRIGGDEFVAILKNDDYLCRNELIDKFRDDMGAMLEADVPMTKRISIASGMAVLVGESPEALNETIRIADERMYMNKTQMKKQNKWSRE